MKKIIIAATVATLGAAAYSLPAYALADDYGQFRYTNELQSITSPQGLSNEAGEWRATIPFNGDKVVASSVFDRIDSDHKQW